MSVIFESRIKAKSNKINDWYIELKDSTDGRIVLCDNLDDYSKKIEEMGSDYGGHIDEVKWFKDDNITQEQYEDVNSQMRKFQDLDK